MITTISSEGPSRGRGKDLSPKVLDRANVIDMSSVDIRSFCENLISREDGIGDVLDETTVNLLCKISDSLEPSGLHFGYRAVEEIAKYLKAAKSTDCLQDRALDVQIEQKLLSQYPIMGFLTILMVYVILLKNIIFQL